jgi:hypothetical protein
MMGNRWLSTTKVAGRISKTRCIYILAPFRERPTINLYYRYHVIKQFDLIKSGFTFILSGL